MIEVLRDAPLLGKRFQIFLKQRFGRGSLGVYFALEGGSCLVRLAKLGLRLVGHGLLLLNDFRRGLSQLVGLLQCSCCLLDG